MPIGLWMDEKRWVCLVHCVVGARFREVGGGEGWIERKEKRRDFVRGPTGGVFGYSPHLKPGYGDAWRAKGGAGASHAPGWLPPR